MCMWRLGLKARRFAPYAEGMSTATEKPKPIPYCSRCQANNGVRCGICDEADYTDGSGRRQREAAHQGPASGEKKP